MTINYSSKGIDTEKRMIILTYFKTFKTTKKKILSVNLKVNWTVITLNDIKNKIIYYLYLQNLTKKNSKPTLNLHVTKNTYRIQRRYLALLLTNGEAIGLRTI